MQREGKRNRRERKTNGERKIETERKGLRELQQ